MTEVLSESGATRIEVSRDEAQRLKFWSGRKNAFPASGGISPDYMCMDSTIPRKRLAEMLRAIEAHGGRVWAALRQRFPCRRRQSASADPVRRQRSGRIQALRAVRRRHSGDERRARRDGDRRARRRAWRSSIRCACSSRRPSASSFSRIKRAFDPQELLNPGKVIPTLQRCAEYGKMHIHRGMLPFPDLPRF